MKIHGKSSKKVGQSQPEKVAGERVREVGRPERQAKTKAREAFKTGIKPAKDKPEIRNKEEKVKADARANEEKKVERPKTDEEVLKTIEKQKENLVDKDPESEQNRREGRESDSDRSSRRDKHERGDKANKKKGYKRSLSRISDRMSHAGKKWAADVARALGSQSGSYKKIRPKKGWQEKRADNDVSRRLDFGDDEVSPQTTRQNRPDRAGKIKPEGFYRDANKYTRRK